MDKMKVNLNEVSERLDKMYRAFHPKSIKEKGENKIDTGDLVFLGMYLGAMEILKLAGYEIECDKNGHHLISIDI